MSNDRFIAYCPNCADRGVRTALQVRRNRTTGQQFIGCPKYQECGFQGASLEEYGLAKPGSTWDKNWGGLTVPTGKPRYPISRDDLVAIFRERRDQICQRLETYFFGNPDTGAVAYSGAEFDFYGREPNYEVNSITRTDIDALRLLEVEVDEDTANLLLRDPWVHDVADLLAEIPSTARINDLSSSPYVDFFKDETCVGYRLWLRLHLSRSDIFTRYGQFVGAGLASTSVSKLLARKRTALFPIMDKVVRARLNFDEPQRDIQSELTIVREFHSYVFGVFTLSEMPVAIQEVRDRFSEMQSRRLSLDKIPSLRIFDVAIWTSDSAWFARFH